MKGGVVLFLVLVLSDGLALHVGKLSVDVDRTMLAVNESVNVTVWLETGIAKPSGTLSAHPIRVSFHSRPPTEVGLSGAQCEKKEGYHECLTDHDGKVAFSFFSGLHDSNVTMVVKYEPQYAVDEVLVEFQVGDPPQPSMVEILIGWIFKMLGF